MLKKGYIRESSLLAVLSMFFVPKKNKEDQLVINYQLLNT